MAKGRKTGGRRKGSPNKVSGTVKDNVVAVFKEIGGVPTMTAWAKANETEFFKLYSKLLPIEGPGDDGKHLLEIIHSSK